MAGQNYRDLLAWQKAMDLVVQIYRATERIPREEMYGLTSQLRRAAVSVPSNIAEGQGRRTKKEFARFLGVAHGSLREMETQLLIAGRLVYLAKSTIDELMELASPVGRLITGLLNSLRRANDVSS
jgi:four helix bundle protein